MIQRTLLHTALAGALALATTPLALAGTFVFSHITPNAITHPHNVGGNASPSTTVCLDPSAQPSGGGSVETAIRNAVATFNRLNAVPGNVKSAFSAGVPGGRIDFESVMVHELGHCLGLDHIVQGPSELGCSLGSGGTCASNPAIYSTLASPGTNGALNVANGSDGMRASRDDIRGDDVNRHWYQRGVNNPFAMPPAVVDRNTFAVGTGFLPAGHTFAEAATSHSPCGNPPANTASLPGRVPSTQNVMFPVLCTDNALRDLAPDDVNTLRIARAGYDGTQGTSDDYVPQVSYVGKTTSCDVVVRFSGGGFGVCQIGASGAGGNNYVATSGEITFGSAVAWHFNQTDTSQPVQADLAITLAATPSPIERGETLHYTVTVTNNGPATATSVSMTQTLPAGTTYFGSDGSDWDCNPSPTSVTCTRASLGPGVVATIDVTAMVPENYVAPPATSSQATVTSAVNDPVPGNNSATRVVPVSFLADRLFGDGFE